MGDLMGWGGASRVIPAVLVLASLTLCRTRLGAQESGAFRIQSLTGQLAGSFDGSWVEADILDPRSMTRWREWLELRMAGSVIHPRVASFQITARPLLAQGRYLPAVDTLNPSGSGNALTGGARLALFGGSTISGSAHGSRTHRFLRTGYGGDQLQDVDEWGLEVKDNDRRMPARISYVSRNERRDWDAGLSARRTLREEWTRTFKYVAQSSKTRLYFERRSYRRGTDYVTLKESTTDPWVVRSDLDFVQRTGDATHRLRWGKGSTLFSRLRYFDRAPDLAFSSLNWSEGASLRQSRTITSDISGAWTRQSTPLGRGSETRGRYLLRFEPSRTLRLDVDAERRSTTSAGVTRVTKGVGPRVSLDLSPLHSVRISAHGNASYRWNSQTATEELFAEAVQEQHRPDAAGTFQLDNPFVDPTSVVVFSATGDRVYEEGFDFRVVRRDPFIEIHVLPGSRIGEDETLLVDYRFEVVPHASGRGLILQYDISLSLGPLVLGARRVRLQDLGALADLPPGTARFLGDEDRADLTATLSQRVGRLVGSVRLQDGRYSSLSYNTRSRSAHGQLSVVLLNSVTVASAASWQSVTGGSTDYVIRRADQSLRWQVTPAVRVNGIGSYWEWVQTDRVERLGSAGASLELGRNRRTLTIRYDYRDWRIGYRTSEHRLSFGLAQKF